MFSSDSPLVSGEDKEILSDDNCGRSSSVIAETGIVGQPCEVYQLSSTDTASLPSKLVVSNPIHHSDRSQASRLQITSALHERIPSEILSAIFVHSLDGKAISLPPDSGTPPWVLGRVCWYWRNVMLEEPNLWNYISLDMSVLGLKSVAKALNLLPSNGLLSITIDSSDGSFYIQNAVFCRVIIPYLPRLRYLKLVVCREIIQRLLELPQEAFSCVETLSLVNSPPAPEPSTIDLNQMSGIFMSATRLRRLTLMYLPLVDSQAFTDLPIRWEQLMELDLTMSPHLPFNRVLLLLRRCNHLVKFKSAVEKAPDDWVYTAGDCRLPDLQLLDIAVGDAVLLKYLFVPALIDLRVKGSIQFPNKDLTAMILRSQCQLLVLDCFSELSGEQNSGSELDTDNDLERDCNSPFDNASPLDAFLPLIPSLHTFSVFSPLTRASTLKKIAQGTLLPRLRTMSIRVESPIIFVDLVEQWMAPLGEDDKACSLRSATASCARIEGWALALERLQALNRRYGPKFFMLL